MPTWKLALMFAACFAIGAALPSLARATDDDAAQCEIHVAKTASLLRIETIVRGEPGSSGVYDFTLTRSGSGGSADVSQSGAYTIAEDGEATLSINEFNRSRSDRLDAMLSIDTPEGRIECEKSI